MEETYLHTINRLRGTRAATFARHFDYHRLLGYLRVAEFLGRFDKLDQYKMEEDGFPGQHRYANNQRIGFDRVLFDLIDRKVLFD